MLEIRAAGHEAAPHLSCIASTRKDIAEQLERYRANGIRHLVALRGDLPSGIAAAGEFRYASELVGFIRETTGDWFHIEVACYPEYHPQTRNAADELRNFKRKVDAGANAAITQYFYNADAYFRFVDEARARRHRRADRSRHHADRATSRSSRASRTPAAPRSRAGCASSSRATATTPTSIRAFGLDVVSDLCRKLIDAGAPGLHFYTLNQAALSVEIWRRLGL